MMTREAGVVDEFTYSPSRVRYFIRNFAEIRSMASGGAAARGLLIPGPTPESPKVGAHQSRYYRADTWTHIVADLERAINALSDKTEWRIVVAVAQQGWSVGTFAERSNIQKERAERAFDSACERMAAFLGWSEDVEGD
jgi:hypothetical protein